MNLTSALAEKKQSSVDNIPADNYAIMQQETQKLIKSNISDLAPKLGEVLSNFALPNQNGTTTQLSDLTKKGPVIVTFYRGGWCPYCNLELQAYQAILNDINEEGATLVAISPELPDASLSTHEKNALSFEVLSDIDSQYAKQLNLVFTLPDVVKPIYNGFGIDVEKHNGSGQFDLPLAATFLIDTNGIVKSAFVEADYTLRKEPTEILEELRQINA